MAVIDNTKHIFQEK